MSLSVKRLMVALALIILIASSVDALTLAKNGKAGYVIVIADNAIAPEKTAARELQSHLNKVTGANFKIVTESQAKGNKPQILVGRTQKTLKLLPDIDWQSLKYDGIVIRTKGSDLILAGGQPRGSLYAVYTFLEDTVGCRWWTSTEQFIPRKHTLVIPEINTTYTPRLLYREAFYRDPLSDRIFPTRLKLNGSFYKIPSNYGGHYSIIGWCHTFYQLLPPEKYFDKHPEWYSEINGKRTASGAQLCLTNDEMRKELTRVALERIRQNPDAGIISISQNDWHGPCQCPKCKAVAQEEGSESGPLIRFVNAVAEEIEKEFPEVLVETLAYQYTRKPPMHVTPRKNVVVRLCTIECSFAHPLDSETNKTFRDDIKGWSAIAPNLYIWDYVTDFANYIQPHPNMRVLAPNLRFFADNKAIGIFEQGDSACSVGDFVRLRAWVLGHLLWDQSKDDKKLIQEFLKGYYGNAAPYLSSYLNLVHDAVERKGMGLSCYNGDLTFLTYSDMSEATRLFNEAEKAASKNPDILKRVKRERLPLDHVWLLRYDELKRQAEKSGTPFPGPADPREACNAFIKSCEDWDARNYSEGLAFETYKNRLKARFGPPAPAPEAFASLPKDEYIDIQDSKFKLFNQPQLADTVDDPKASDGKAAKMPGSHIEWAVQYHINQDLVDSAPGEWNCYVIARCDAKTSSGGAFNIGIYDQSGGEIIRIGDSIEHAGDGSYHTYSLGTHKLHPGMYVWVSPVGNGDVTGIYVDRVILVKDKGSK